MTVDRYVRAATRDNTRRCYRSAVEHFEVTWGGFLPATADSVARYLADHAERLSAATLKQRLAALARWHRDQGFPDPTKAPLVRTVLKGIREEHPYRQKQAKPLAVTQLQQLDQWLAGQIAEARQHDARRLGVWLRNRAMVLLGFWRAFRSDELCRLNIEDVALTPGAGMSFHLRRSKGDRQAEGRMYKVPALKQCCPVEACQDWLEFLNQPSGSLFRAIDRWGHISDVSLHPNSIVPLLRQLLADADIDAAQAFSSHSLRRGFATWASASGWEIKALMEYVGWQDAQTALRYIEAKSPFEQALMQIPTVVASAAGQPRLTSAPEPSHRALTVQLTLEPQSPRSRKHHQARTVIETHCLKPFEVKRQDNGNYHIKVPATSDDQLDEMMDDLIDEIHRIASDKACWVEALITDPATWQAWE